ncbi:MAG: hypothetical protein QOI04_904 [Verrucomicrobiota bacterium]|jgi:hypothetical protein
MAPAILGITAVMYAVRSRRQRERFVPLPQIEANLGGVTGEHVTGDGRTVDPDSDANVSRVSASAIGSPVFPAEEHKPHPIPLPISSPEKWELPLTNPVGHTARDEVIAGLSPTPRSPTARRVATVAAIVVASTAIGFATFGRARSHAARSNAPVQQTSNTATASVADLAVPAIDSSTPPVMSQTTEATPPAEGPALSPSPSATVTPKTDHPRRHRTRARHPRSIIDKTRTFLRKTF